MNNTIGNRLGKGLTMVMTMVFVMGAVSLWANYRVKHAMDEKQRLEVLNGLLSSRIIDHFKWKDGLSSGLFMQGKKFSGKLNPDECNFGKWMTTFKPYSEANAAIFEALREPHRKLHESAVRILAEYGEGNKIKA